MFMKQVYLNKFLNNRFSQVKTTLFSTILRPAFLLPMQIFKTYCITLSSKEIFLKYFSPQTETCRSSFSLKAIKGCFLKYLSKLTALHNKY